MIQPAQFVRLPDEDTEPVLDVNQTPAPLSALPLVLVLNARSLYNKAENYRALLHNISPDISICSETWG